MQVFACWLLAISLSAARGALQEVHIGTSYGYKTKCVSPRGPVVCPRHVRGFGRYPDSFEIYQENGKVCARRTDYDGDWSVHLKVYCQGRSHAFSGMQRVRIGHSLLSNVKCIHDPPGVTCDSSAKQVGRTGKYPDTFHIYHHGEQLCARRTDQAEGWDLDLVLECQRQPGAGPGPSGASPAFGGGQRRVTIGSSLDSHVKCVDAPAGVHCEETAKQLGRTGKYPDSFHIYHHADQICARRTDAEAGWGLDLVLECNDQSESGSQYHSSYHGGTYHGGYHGGTYHGGTYHGGSYHGGSYHGGSYHSGYSGGVRKITIGSSLDSHVKCVDAPSGVHCEETAKQLGRTGKYPDTFHIYHHADQICARRTDAEAGWGLDLVLECNDQSESGSHGFGDFGGSYEKRYHFDDESDYHYGGHHSGSLYIPNEHSSGSPYHSSYHGGSYHGGSYHGGSYHGGSYHSGYSGGVRKIAIGSSLDSHVKCVDAPAGVHCEETAKQLGRTGKYPDTFHIYHHADQICARRTDAEAGWGLDLVLECRSTGGGYDSGFKGGEDDYHEHDDTGSASYNQRKKQVTIGSSSSSRKCVEDPGHVHCDNQAKQIGRSGEYPDTFHIYHEGTQICAKRTDADAAWGINLVLECDLYYGQHYGSSSESTTLQIGTSQQSALKCVADPGHVVCDDTAEQVGRTGEYPDTFHIYHHNQQICAQRTDANVGWGLNLVIDCRPAGKGTTGDTDGSFWYITEKVRSCCQQHLFSVACPYDCEAGDHQVQAMWSSTKRQWCCWNRNLGCDGSHYPPSSSPVSPAPYDCHTADPASTAPAGHDENVNVVSPTRYDCNHGHREMWTQDKAQYCRLWLEVPKGYHYNHCDDTDPVGWTREKARWCKEMEEQERHSPHKCSRGHPDTWTQQKFEFCCVIKGIGCRQEDPLGEVIPGFSGGKNRNNWEDAFAKDTLDKAPNHPYPKPGQGFGFDEPLHFDCVPEDPADLSQWSPTRQRWCCQKWGLACKAIGTFNCSAGLWNWQRGWSAQKKNFCCQHEKKGCDGTAFDCSQATADLSEDGRKWCCANHMYSDGCPFNCQQGLKQWKVGFSHAKKMWCCKYEKLACHEAPPGPLLRGGLTHPHAPHPVMHALHQMLGHHVVGHGESHGLVHHDSHGLVHGESHGPVHHESHGLVHGESHVPQSHGATSHWLHFAGEGHHAKPGFSACHNIADRPEGLVDWCCRQMGLCHLSVSFDCHVGVHNWMDWSRDKKDHCCGREVHCSHSVTHVSEVTHVVHHPSELGSEAHHSTFEHLGNEELDDPQAWFNKKNVINLHVGQSPNAGTKCVTPSAPVSCPMDAGNVRHDEYPDRFRVYRKGGQVCAQRTDYDKLWGLDLVLKCIELDDENFKKVHVGSSESSQKCVTPESPVTCDDAASQAGRTDPHPDTFHVYHSGHQICVKRTDANSHWGVDLVLYCRQGSWSSPYWRASRMRTLEEGFYDRDVPAQASYRKPLLLITMAFAALFLLLTLVMLGKAYRQHQRSWTLLESTEERLDCLMNGRTPWLARPNGDVDTVDARESETVLA